MTWYKNIIHLRKKLERRNGCNFKLRKKRGRFLLLLCICTCMEKQLIVIPHKKLGHLAEDKCVKDIRWTKRSILLEIVFRAFCIWC